MYEARLRRLLLAFYVLLGVIGARAFALQVLGATDADGRPWASLAEASHPMVVLPRRGEILWADGTPMARNVPMFGLEIRWGEVDHRIVPTVEEFRAAWPRELTAEQRDDLEKDARDLAELRERLFHPKPDSLPQTRWTCRVCGTGRASRGAPDRDCRECGQHDFQEELPIRAEDVSVLCEKDVHNVHLALLGALRRWRLNRDWRSHAFLYRVPESALDAIDIYRDVFAGFVSLPRNGRVVDPLGRWISGGTRPPTDEEAERLAADCRAALGVSELQKETFYPTLLGTSLLEGRFDAALRGYPGESERVRLRENEFRLETRVIRPVVDGEDLRTTLRRGLQELAQEIVEADAPEGGHGAAVVIDVRTGAVVALASTHRDAMDHARSHVIPGSVYKLVTAVALLEAGLSPDAMRTCSGKKVRIPEGGRYSCMHVDGDIALHDAFVRSCNGYFAQQAVSVGAEALVSAATRLGLEERPLRDRLVGGGATACGLELSSPTTHPEQWKVWNLSQIGIGQGAASASPLQTVLAYARVANGGRLIRPFVLERDRPAPGSIEVDPVLARWSRLLRDAMRDVVLDEHGTAYDEVALREVRAAGKTGTAEVAIAPKTFLNNTSFVGYAPYDDPRYCAIVVLERMPEKRYGAEAAGNHVAELLREALREQ